MAQGHGNPLPRLSVIGTEHMGLAWLDLAHRDAGKMLKQGPALGREGLL